MSTAEPLDNCSLPESSQQSSGALNFILSKLGRPSRNGSKGGPAMSGGCCLSIWQACQVLQVLWCTMLLQNAVWRCVKS